MVEIDVERVARSPFAAGALGALVGLKGVPGATWGERSFNVLSGALIAGFLAPAAAAWFGLTGPEMQSAMAFMSGIFGMSLVAALLDAIKANGIAGLLSMWRSPK